MTRVPQATFEPGPHAKSWDCGEIVPHTGALFYRQHVAHALTTTQSAAFFQVYFKYVGLAVLSGGLSDKKHVPLVIGSFDNYRYNFFLFLFVLGNWSHILVV
jgi:hypothetical protein